jgi:SAM-dependent methyltransferase
MTLMKVRNIKDRFLSLPWVYDTLRPLAIGSLDYGRVARFCAVTPDDCVFEIGCGTGQLIPFLRCRNYLGVDTDSAALRRAKRFASPTIRFMEGDSWDRACQELNPNVVLMIGLVHHIPDDVFQSMVCRLEQGSGRLPRIVSFEATYLKGYPLSNLLSALDRGRYVRTPEAYEALFARTGLRVTRKEIIPTRLGHARYIGFHLEAPPQ